MRFLFYSHDGVGLGHTRRHLAIAAALTELAPAASVLLASGAEEIIRCGLPPRIDVLKLPGLRKVTNDQYRSRRLHMAASEIRSLRSALLQTAVKSFRPDVVLVDKHPFGAKGEFRDGLEEVRALGSRAALGLRDILDERSTVLHEWGRFDMQELISQHYDLVLIYGEQTVFDPVAAYNFPPAMAERTRFCGYVTGQSDAQIRRDLRWTALNLEKRARPVVLGTTGGGEDGFALMESFIRAARGAPWEAVAVAGPMTSSRDLRDLEQLATEARIKLHTFIPSLADLFGCVDALVCMGGYNTLVEAVSSGVPTICVPRISPRVEQRLRAEAFAKLGLLSMLLPDDLNEAALRNSIEAALHCSKADLSKRGRAGLNFDGARVAAAHLLALTTEKPCFANGAENEIAPFPHSRSVLTFEETHREGEP